jgi:hypothetical protein
MTNQAGRPGDPSLLWTALSDSGIAAVAKVNHGLRMAGHLKSRVLERLRNVGCELYALDLLRMEEARANHSVTSPLQRGRVTREEIPFESRREAGQSA